MRKFLLTTLLGVVIVTPAFADKMPTYLRGLAMQARTLDKACRKEVGVDNYDDLSAVCKKSLVLTDTMENLGWCFGLRGQLESAMVWQQCNDNTYSSHGTIVTACKPQWINVWGRKVWYTGKTVRDDFAGNKQVYLFSLDSEDHSDEEHAEAVKQLMGKCP